ncbi:equilibrative nucleotide transporter 3-like [Papaver somniferum]|uniref:equilibrative nucleotide transporter 3-like n=1 Tax=Papaver somniferum TaxID=3469 RepID=UPI000E6FEC38|nr:equilibrative nucleotide transporter 3-like [Papaver somniferum]
MAIHGANREGKLTATVVCWILGNGCLFPWYSMVTSFDYFGDIFPKYHPGRILPLVCQPFALGTFAILTYNVAKINTRRRNLLGYFIFFIGSLMVPVLDIATSGEGGIGTYIGVCLISSAYGVANALVEGGLVGDLSLMCPEFMQSFLVGLSFAGALTSALRLITKVAFENSKNGLRKGAMMFFAISVLFELLCLLLYAYIFPKLPIVKYYRAKAASEGSKTVSADLVAGGIQTLPSNQNLTPTLERWQAAEEDLKYMDRLSNKELFVQNMDFAITVLLIYVLSFSIFPGFLSEDTGKHGLGTWYGIVLIATFNIWDLIGTYIPLIECLKLRSRKGLLITSLSRFLLIPCFYFTVKLGDQGWMIMLTSILGLTSGYLTVRVLTVAPKGYKGPEQNALGNFLVLFLAMGIFVGVTLDWLWLIGKGW